MAETQQQDKGKTGNAKSGETGGAKAGQNQAQEADDVRQSDPTGGGRIDAIVVGSEDGVGSEAFEVKQGEEFVTLTQDVLEEFYYPDTTRPAYRLLYTKGQVVSKSAIDQYNADVERKKAEADLEGDDLVRARIDQTTLASGTYPGVEQEKVEAGRK